MLLYCSIMYHRRKQTSFKTYKKCQNASLHNKFLLLFLTSWNGAAILYISVDFVTATSQNGVCITKEMCLIMILFHDCCLIKNVSNNKFFLSFWKIFFFYLRGSLKVQLYFILQPLQNPRYLAAPWNYKSCRCTLTYSFSFSFWCQILYSEYNTVTNIYVQPWKTKILRRQSKMSLYKKFTCTGTSLQVFICLWPRTPYPPPLAHCIRVYSILIRTGKGVEVNQKEG